MINETIPPEPLLKVTDLHKHFGVQRGPMGGHKSAVRALDGVSFELAAGETLGLVGESGCGKSTLVRTLLRLGSPTAGSARLEGQDIYSASGPTLKHLRRRMQVVFQDPYQAFNPRFTVAQSISEAWQIHPEVLPPSQRPDRVTELLTQVGLRPEHANRFPHEFSGGQRQRIGIARALALEPALIVCDEPVSALDVSVQAQVVNLLTKLQRERGLAFLFVAHDLAVVRHISRRVAVMYLGKIVEIGPVAEIFSAAAHPYTQALLSAVPVANPVGRENRSRIVLRGDPPSPVSPPSGCRFRTRCWMAQEICSVEEPELKHRTGNGLLTACHFAAAQANHVKAHKKDLDA